MKRKEMTKPRKVIKRRSGQSGSKAMLAPSPEGYKLVPIIPTEAMQHAGSAWVKQCEIRTKCYQAMVDAAPTYNTI